MPAVPDFRSTEFDDAVRAAGRKAFEETLAAGLPVFYLDACGLNVMEYGDGRRFEIRWRRAPRPERISKSSAN